MVLSHLHCSCNLASSLFLINLLNDLLITELITDTIASLQQGIIVSGMIVISDCSSVRIPLCVYKHNLKLCNLWNINVLWA